MSTRNDCVAKPRRRLWRTLLRRPRNLRRLVARVPYTEAASEVPDQQEVGHWGQVVLLHDATVALHRDGTVSRSVHLVTMLHGDQDLAEWDEITRTYDRRNSLETIRKAIVHLPDGTRRKAERTVTQLDPHSRLISLQFLPLKPGVIVEFEEQFDRFTPDDVAPCVWEQMFLQSWTPCRRLRFTAAIAAPFEAEFRLHHCDWQPQVTAEHGYQVYRWDLRDVPGIEMDQWTPHPRDFAPWVDLTTLHSWEPVARYYMRELQPSAKTPKSVRGLTRDLTTEAKTDRDKVSSIYRYATRDVRYGRHPREVTIESPRDTGKMLEDLRGDCKDKSALMVSMLRELTVPAEIALVLTRMNGQAPFLPGPRFDHAVVRATVDGNELWLDPAAGQYTFGDLPLNDQGIRALVLDGDDSHMVNVPEATIEQHRTDRVCHGAIDADGTLRIDAKAETKGDQAVSLRLQYLDRSDEHRQRTLAQSVAVDLTGAEVHDARFTQLEDLTSHVCFESSMTLQQWGRRIQDILLFRIPWSEPIQTSGPVSATHRIQPLAAPGVMGTSERYEIDVPEGFAGYGLPYHTEEECQWGRYCCRITTENSRLVAERTVDYLGGIVSPEQFAEFKRFWETCARADAADVVLMKAETH